MKLRPYKEIIAMSKEKLDAALAPIRAKKVKAQGELEMMKIEEQLTTLEADVQEECSRQEIDFPHLLSLLDKSALLERRRKQYRQVLEELFPE